MICVKLLDNKPLFENVHNVCFFITIFLKNLAHAKISVLYNVLVTN